MKIKKKAAFTFIELMVVTAIFLGVSAAIFAILTGGRRAWMVSESQIDVHWMGRETMRFITEQLSEAGPGTVTITNVNANEDRISFQKPVSYANGVVAWSNIIQYSLGGINNQQFVCTDLGTGVVDTGGNYITTMRFSQPSADLIQVILVLGKQSLVGDNISIQLNSQIALRNR